ncbi:sigma factor [Microbispora sp. NPDC088329]|uniref:sigma factor n=1 Tax=Microbispora sp. NPDC088329 TaxID=3154869 RepID=UPI003445B95E
MTIQSEPGGGRAEPGLSGITGERRQLMNLAYRLLGSLADAEDVVQETYARWCAMSGEEQGAITSPGAWLTKVAGRLCLNVLSSARVRRETYVGEWIPEPLPEPTEWIIGRPGGFGVIPSAPAARQARIVSDFKQALEAGDVDALIGLLAPGVTAISDGGGLVSTALHPIEGTERIVRSLIRLWDRVRGLTLLERTVNGRPGLVAQQDGVTVSVYAFEVAGDRITHIWAVRNPDKLRPWTMGRRQ